MNKSILKSLGIRLVIALAISLYVDRSSIFDFPGILAWALNFLTVPYLVRNENINFKLRIVSAASISIIFFGVIFYFYGNQGTSGPLSNYVRMLFVLYIFSLINFFIKDSKSRLNKNLNSDGTEYYNIRIIVPQFSFEFTKWISNYGGKYEKNQSNNTKCNNHINTFNWMQPRSCN